MSQEHVTLSLTLERLWQFSLQYYSVREVKEACLSLQNNFNGNVNLLLLLKYLDEQQLTLQEQDWQSLIEGIARTETLLHHYRELRRKLKNNLTDTLYREALQFELQLEKQQQSDLIEVINRHTLTINHGEVLTLRYCRQLGAEHLATIFGKPVPASF
ncbi:MULTISPECIES: TIGR02444 family protein [Vibrio]|uniref:TIGR02444 family protein n=1 Tax=Vibrio ostreae TaxID=2841925 RepID=A0A975U9M6_9VIBR|nr:MULTISPECIES: TIGR02444 family protein [Vibrio]QXO17648.1 TIGR02444 family protein [Vibrio ostreae]WGY48038.1 TIGR02444 family protein [Vibrio sp. ABG19]